MTKRETITRRAALTGLAALPMAALPLAADASGSALPADPDETFRKALADFKQAVRDRWPEHRLTFSSSWDQDGDRFLFSGIMVVEVFRVAA